MLWASFAPRPRSSLARRRRPARSRRHPEGGHQAATRPQRMHGWGGALVHGTHSSQDSMAPAAPSSRSPELTNAVAGKPERRSRRGGNDPIGVIQKCRALILLLSLRSAYSLPGTASKPIRRPRAVDEPAG